MTQHSDDLAERLRRSLDARAAGPDLPDAIVTDASRRTPPRVTDPRRRVQVAAGGIVAIAAVAAGAVAIAPSFQRAPLFVAAEGAPASAFGTAEDAATSDLRIANWVEYEYVAGPGLSTDGGSGAVYQLRLAGSPESVLELVADEFGLDGSAEQTSYFDPDYPSYVVGPEDGTGPSAMVSWVGSGNWWYNDPGAYPPLECEPVTQVDPVAPESSDAPVAPDSPDAPVDDTACVPVEPALEDSLAPGEAEARDLALELFERTGLDVSADDIRVTVDPMQTTATAGLVVDGVRTALEWSVAWSSTGDIAWASGHSIEVVDRGDFGTVSPADAVARLADWRWFGAAGPDYQGGVVAYAADLARSGAADVPAEQPAEEDGGGSSGGAVAPTTEPGSTEPAPTEPEPVPTDVAPGEPAPGATIEPAPDATILPEPLPEPTEPEVVEVTVEEAEETLLLVWDADGNAWLVPGFAMPHPDGWWNTVISLVEGVIQLPEPIEVEPLIIEE